MKVIILAGGLGTRLSEETESKPKPMVEIGDYPILWHIMKIYSFYGFNDFIILGGYKYQQIKNYFVNYHTNNCDITVDIATNQVKVHSNHTEPWKVTILNTGTDTLTGSRIKKAADFILQDSEPYFALTYGDGVSDVNIKNVLSHHISSGKVGTMTVVQPVGRFGSVCVDNTARGGVVSSFVEKPAGDGNWINAGFFIFNKEFLNYIPEHNVMLEEEPLHNLVNDLQLSAFYHRGFWKPMDTLRDKKELNDLWANGKAPWKLWK